MKRKVLSVCAVLALAATGIVASLPTSALAQSAAGFTSVDDTVDLPGGHCIHGGATNCNTYDGKQYVWMNGGPVTAGVADGSYFFAVVAPGGQADPNDGSPKLLSTDTHDNRTFAVSNGVITYSGSHDQDGNKIRLAEYNDTPNGGGVYVMAICSLAHGYPVAGGACKYDSFKVQDDTVAPPPAPVADPPTITKDAAGAYDTTWKWSIAKDADATTKSKIGPTSITFHYTVSVTHDGGTDSNVHVTGTIDVVNPNADDSGTIALDAASVTDQLSDGTDCTVDTSAGLTLSSFDNYFPYSCTLTSVPAAALSNTATVTWGDQTLANGADLAAGSANFTFTPVPFTQTKIDDSVAVTDTVAGSLGNVALSDPSPRTFGYDRTVTVGNSGCTVYGNTASFTTNTTATTGSASKSVTACGQSSGALTIGFWQNKNGQAIITGGAALSGVCKSATWLRQYAPFADLSSSASCSTTAKYVSDVIKAASAAGAAMNAMLKAQMLATALDVYFSDASLGTNKIGAPVPIGGLGVDLVKENASSAFGGTGSLTVSQLLAYAAGKSNAGGSAWYGQVKATQEIAKNVFDHIDNGIAWLV